jgi:alpha-tubulin suppressor-like RCC1 family protein
MEGIPRVKDIMCGDSHTVMVAEQRMLICCGDNHQGQLDFVTKKKEVIKEPLRMRLPSELSVSLSSSHTILSQSKI